MATRIAALVLVLAWSVLVPCSDARPKDVLFIAIDDLRTQLGCYGHEQMKTPNIDSLASRSLVFDNAYCQVALCSPSRASLLTGRRPDTNHVWLIAANEYWRQYTNATTIPQYFKENGYVTAGMGKIFHPGAPSGQDDIAYSWSLPYYHSPLQVPYGTSNKTAAAWAFQGFQDNQLPDGQIADQAVTTILEIQQNRSKGDNTPFFLAVGFHKPHLPFYAPAKYFDLYPPASEFKLAENMDAPEGMPPIAFSTWNSLTTHDDVKAALPEDWNQCHMDPERAPNSTLCRIPDDVARQMRRAYSACISYTDAQVGRVVSELEQQGLADNTVIVLWADHGWQLGEHNEWCKFTNFEDATHVPFMIRVPGVTDQGSRTKALVELIDIFPTLTELAGVEKPPLCPETGKGPLACVEGTSVAPLLQDPTQEWKKAAFSQYARPSCGFHQIPGHPPFDMDNLEYVMGYTMRVDSYRYTEWLSFDHDTATPSWDDVWGVELYNHTDPVVFFNDENINMADMPSMKSVVTELHQVLKAGWRSAQPPSADHH